MSCSHFDYPVQQTWPKTITGFAKAAYTVFTTPSTPGHDNSIYTKVAEKLRAEPIPVQPPLGQELAAIAGITSRLAAAPKERRQLANRELLGLMGILMQFTSYLPELRPYCETPYENVERLYKAFIGRTDKAPLNFSQQMAIALEQTAGDVLEALW
jgi:hypothetical protein